MKKITRLLSVTALVLASFVIISACKKKKDDPVVINPAFIVTATTVNLQAGGLGLQFFAKCTNDDVKMTKVNITDPIASMSPVFNLDGTYFVKDQIFALQATDEAYIKSSGTWKFNFIGNRTADGVAFSANATVDVSGK